MNTCFYIIIALALAALIVWASQEPPRHGH